VRLARTSTPTRKLDAPDTVDQLIERLRAGFGLALPAADLLLSQLMMTSSPAKHVGRGVIDGIECEHVTFRNPEQTGSCGSKSVNILFPANT